MTKTVGSVWNKWDLHVHTPSSIIQNYGGDTNEAWSKFIEKIASLPPEIKVIGITDYLFIDGYEKILQRRNEIPNIELIVPNIEFRLNTFSGTENNKKRHNFHIIFDPKVKPSDIKEQLLNCISTGYRIEDRAQWNSTPTRESLAELGRMIKDSAPAGNSVHQFSDLLVGFENITYKKEDILELLKKHQFFGKYLIGIGYSEWDQSRWDQSAAEKRNLINQADFCLTNLDDISKIGENIQELEENKLNSLILHSSDAHSFENIGKTNLWIKADTIFAGLKQILNESKSRVFLGANPPNYKNSHQVISKIEIKESNGWFPSNFKLELNRDLVSIIGGRGSGKSALVEMIAYGAGSKDENSDCFINKATKHSHSIKGAEIKLTWEDNHVTGFKIGELVNDQENIRYLPQKAVEQLCSPSNTEELLSQIENVIFQALDDTQRMGSSSFKELQNRILKNFAFSKNQIIVEIQNINRHIFGLEQRLEGLPKKVKELEENKKQIKILQDTLPKLAKEDVKDQEELAELNRIKKIIEGNVISNKLILEKLEEIQTEVNLLEINVSSFTDNVLRLAKEVGINDTSAFVIKINKEEIKKTLKQKKDEMEGVIAILESGEKDKLAKLIGIQVKDLPAKNLRELNEIIKEKINKTRAHETEKIKYQRQKLAITEIEKMIKSLEDEIKEVNEQVKEQLKEKEGERFDKYSEFFQVLNEEKNEIEKLYKPLQKTLETGTETSSRLKFIAKIKYKVEQHEISGLNILDRTRKGNFREEDSLGKSLREFWDRCNAGNLQGTKIKQALESLREEFVKNVDGLVIKIEDQLREDFNSLHFYDWLFDLDCFEVVSSLEFDGTELYLLSPGQKGIVLLMLYLHIDEKDQRPLIIDQPEDNLDNLSVYLDVIDFFRQRKLFRQIIIITHNPNLVVNTDSEQVIVANYNGRRAPRLSYSAGSLENHSEKLADSTIKNGIIEQVCDILEGGKTAFTKRGNKYKSSGLTFK